MGVRNRVQQALEGEVQVGVDILVGDESQGALEKLRLDVALQDIGFDEEC